MKFKPGDKVRLLKRFPGSHLNWIEGKIGAFQGKIVTIVRRYKGLGWVIKEDNDENWWPDDLFGEKVNDKLSMEDILCEL